MRTLACLAVSYVLGSGVIACSGPADVASKNNEQSVGGNATDLGGSGNGNPSGGSTTAQGGTATGGSTAAAQVGELHSDTPADTNPDITDAEYATFIANANDFGLTLYQGVNAGTTNAVFSPTSAQLALGMTYAGAVGDTAAGMQTALHDSLGSTKYFAGCNRLLSDLASRNLSLTDAGNNTLRVELAPANSLWADLTVSVKTPFLDTLAAEFGSGMYRVDFIGQPDPSRIAINNWVSDRTHDRIQNLLMPGDVDTTTRFVLVNALYFYANWSDLFVKTATTSATFHTLAGTDVSVNTMHKSSYMQYKSTSSYDMLQIPYVANDLSMVVVLPQAGEFDATRTQLSAQWVQDNRSGLTSTYVDLSLPKFKIETDQMHLAGMLSSMGMQLAFDVKNADFTGMTDLKPLYISDVIQKAFIGVDEDGTEAAAATAVILDTASIQPTPVPFTVDRPFLFYIQDKTGLVLFAGQVVDPSS